MSAVSDRDGSSSRVSVAGEAQRARTGAWDGKVVTEVTMFINRYALALGAFKRAWSSYNNRW